MGAAQSGGVEIGGSSMGFQVLRVYPNSPGSQAGLKAYFDFIVAIGDKRFNKEDGSLREILKASVDQKLKMVVFNTRSKAAREVEIIPNTSWGGSGLLGVSIKHSSFDRADERVWHVVEVDPGSPAHQAGFKAGEDYVIGSDSILQENDDLYNLIETHEGKALKLFVYNVKTDNCREVLCHPNSKWGGRGYLGCEFGHGLLHRIPLGEKTQNGAPISSTASNSIAAATTTTTLAGDSRMAPSVSSTQNVSSPQTQPLGNPYSFQKQSSMQNRPTQPGYQLFQQALFDNRAQSPPQQQPQAPEAKPLPPPPQVPQTFAQLANAQYQAQQQQQQHQQQPPPQQQQEQQGSQTQQQVAPQPTDYPYQPPVVRQQSPPSVPVQEAGAEQPPPFGPPAGQQYQQSQQPSFINYNNSHHHHHQQQQLHQAPPPFTQSSPPLAPPPTAAPGPYNQASSDRDASQQGGRPLSPPPQAPPKQPQPAAAQQQPAPYQYFASQPAPNQPPPAPQMYNFNQLPSLQQLPPMYPPPPPPAEPQQTPQDPPKDDSIPQQQTQFNQVANQRV